VTRYDGIFEQLRADLSRTYDQPIEAAVMVHKSPDQPRGGPRLATNNHLALTPTHLRLHRLGGRTGVKVRDEVVAWDRRTVRVEAADAARSSWFASVGSSYDFDVHSLRIRGPEGDLVLDVMQENHLMDPKAEIQRLLAALAG
jgi:hypothetical protein